MTVPDGNLWFTETSANQIDKGTTSDVFTEYGFRPLEVNRLESLRGRQFRPSAPASL